MNTEQNYESAGSIATNLEQAAQTSSISHNQAGETPNNLTPTPRQTRRPFKDYADMQFDLRPDTEYFEISDAAVVVEALQAYRHDHWEELKENLNSFAEGELSESKAREFANRITSGHIRLLLTIIERSTDNIDAMTDQMDVANYYHYHRNS